MHSRPNRRTDERQMKRMRVSDPKLSGRHLGSSAAKALVLAEIAHLVEQGLAVASILESGAIEVRFVTGEIFHLGQGHVSRVA